jgi:hypothetical protein
MDRRTKFRLAAMASGVLAAQLAFGQDLATRLATPQLREAAVKNVADSGGKDLALLLSWSEAPPKGLDRYQLNLGLIEAFGKLRAKESIPFLIRWMNLDSTGMSENIWMKSDSVVESRLPVIDTLIAIGPDASKALIAAWDKMPGVLHIEALFVVSRIADPAARDFLLSVHTTDPRDARYVQQGLQAIQERH